MGCSIRTDHWRFTEWAEGRSGTELYDHYSDPMEFHNLALKPDPAATSIITRLSAILRRRPVERLPPRPSTSLAFELKTLKSKPLKGPRN